MTKEDWVALVFGAPLVVLLWTFAGGLLYLFWKDVIKK